MRIEGLDYSTIRNKSTVILDRSVDSGLPPIELTVHALPPTYAEEAETEVTSPKAPRIGVSRNKKGRIDKDEMGRPIMLYDEQDESYLAEMREVQQLQAIKMIVDALDPMEVQFEAQKNGTSPRDYYKAVRTELVAFGFSLGDYVTLIKAISRVSNLDEKDVKVGRLDFFETENSPVDSLSTESVAS